MRKIFKLGNQLVAPSTTHSYTALEDHHTLSEKQVQHSQSIDEVLYLGKYQHI